MILFSSSTFDNSDSSRSAASMSTTSNLKPPMCARRRRKSASTNTTLTSTDSFFTPARAVRFSEEQPQIVGEAVAFEEPEEIWFPMDYLQQTRREEIKNNLRAQYFSSKDNSNSDEGAAASIESDKLTWRGLEDILEKYNRKDKQAKHTLAVVNKYKSQRDALSPKGQHSLRQFSKTLSKPDRHKATELAAQDAALVDRPVRSTSPLSNFASNVANSVRSWSPGPAVIRRSHNNSTSADRRMKYQRQKSHSMDINLFRWRMGGDKIMGCSSHGAETEPTQNHAEELAEETQQRRNNHN